jgi:hypothetical protein
LRTYDRATCAAVSSTPLSFTTNQNVLVANGRVYLTADDLHSLHVLATT